MVFRSLRSFFFIPREHTAEGRDPREPVNIFDPSFKVSKVASVVDVKVSGCGSGNLTRSMNTTNTNPICIL